MTVSIETTRQNLAAVGDRPARGCLRHPVPQIREVVKEYPGSVCALDGVSLRVDAGEAAATASYPAVVLGATAAERLGITRVGSESRSARSGPPSSASSSRSSSPPTSTGGSSSATR